MGSGSDSDHRRFICSGRNERVIILQTKQLTDSRDKVLTSRTVKRDILVVSLVGMEPRVVSALTYFSLCRSHIFSLA